MKQQIKQMVRRAVLSLTVSLILLGGLPIQVKAETTSSSNASISVDQLSQTEETKPVIQDVEGLRLELVQRTQDPVTGEVRFDLIIYPQFTSDRVQVTWTVNGVSELVGKEVQALSLRAGNQYAVYNIVKPRQLGVTDLLVRVEAFAADGVYLATGRKSFGSLSNGEVFPVTTQYRIAQVLGLIRNLGLVGLGIILIFWAVRFGNRKLQAWLKRDN